MPPFKRLFISAVAVVFLLTPGRAADWLNAGLLHDEFALTLEPGHRTEALGPLFYFEEKDTQQTWAVPPVFSFLRDPDTESAEFDLGYPVLTYDRYGSEYRWQLFQLLSFAGGQNQAEEKARRFTLFPVYFQQRSDNPDLNYTALLPIYGRLKNRLMRDEVFFVMFPIYGQSRKRDVVTDNYLYPVFHLRRGDGLHGWQVWPAFGREHKEITTRTNGFGDVATVGGHDKLFVAWPFFLYDHLGIGTGNPVKQHASLPLYSVLRSPQRDSTTIGWPFFTHITDREKNYRELQAPWPLVIFARGEGKTMSRVWPFFSQGHSTNLQSSFYLWPVYKYNRLHSGALDRSRTRILFFLYSDTIQKNVETGNAQRRIDLWPLFTHQRDYNGRSRTQVLAVLEPLLPASRSVERNYSQIWSLWRAENHPGTLSSSQSLLWNLYRRETTPETKKCSLLFGLFQYQSDSGGKRLRLLYIPVAKTRSTVNTDAP